MSMMIHSELILLTVIPAAVAVAVTVVVIGATRVRTFRLRRRRLETADRIELATHAAAAVDAAATSVKKMIEVLPGTSAAFTGRSAVAAIEATSQAILAILVDLPARMQRLEESVVKLDAGLKDMRELFNRLGR
jgi:hypothetical protein